MQEIIGKDLWNVLVMVIRYYGGTKLGTGDWSERTEATPVWLSMKPKWQNWR
jgi:hypothetical protein